jgi:glycine betaine/proline transport system substrate-binding protein
MKNHVIKIMVLFLALTLLSGCQKTEDGTADTAKKKVDLIYVEWSSEVASTNVVKAVLQEKLGYEVDTIPVGGAAMWQGLATGDADAMVAAWLPTTHANYLEKVKDRVVDLGPNLVGTRIGLVVPSYVAVDSIAELNANADTFDGKIIGIDPGAGIMSKTEKVVEAYGLDRMELMVGSGATMTAALADAIKQHNPIVVTGWTPHWMFAKWDLKYLKDPKNIYGGEEEIRTFVRMGLKEDMPEVYNVLDKFNWALEDMQQVMVWNRQEGTKPYENAKRWINEHPEKVEAWLP